MNSSFFSILSSRKTLVYHVGSEAGFFSEFNNMVLGILYCYLHNINFKLYSKDANFGYKFGWTDYFEPFCEEVSESFHSLYNFRQPVRRRSYLFMVKVRVYKCLFRFDYLTHEIWPYFHNNTFEKKHFFIEGKCMNIIDASNYVINLIWSYNEETKSTIDKIIKQVALPNEYVGLQIRRGDKVNEYANEKLVTYMNKLKQTTDMKDIFIATDDYDVVCSLKEQYPMYNYFTLTDESEHGYYQSAFNKKSDKEKKNDILKLLATMDILRRAEYCVGTYNSNLGMFLGMCMKDRMIGVDYDEWRIW